MSSERPSTATSLGDAPHHSATLCKCCVGQENSWKQSLTIGKHGCSVCRHLFDASSWKPDTIKRHRSSSRDLVCGRCSKRGYAPNRYQRYQCAECLDEFGFRQFPKHALQNAKRQKGTRMVCKQCRQSDLRCSKCKIRYEDAYWTKTERMNHRSHKTKLVCKPCRAQGFHPRDIVSYTCLKCKGKFGGHKFNVLMLKNAKLRKHNRLQCVQCVYKEKHTETSAATKAPATSALKGRSHSQ